MKVLGFISVYCKNHRGTLVLLFLPIILVIIALRLYLFSPGIAEFSELLYSQNFSLLLSSHLHAWDTSVSLGHSNLVFPEALGDRQVYGSVGSISTISLLLFLTGLQTIFGPWTQKLYFFFILALPFYSILPLAWYWFGKEKQKFIPVLLTSLFYGINGFIISRFITASLNLNIAHGLLPLAIYCFFKSIEDYPPKKKNLFLLFMLVCGVILSFIIQLRLHYFFLFILFIIGYVLFVFLFEKERMKKVVRYIVSIFAINSIAFLLNIHQWLPLIFYKLLYLESNSLSYHSLLNLLTNSVYNTFGNSLALLPGLLSQKAALPSFTHTPQIVFFIPFFLSCIAVVVRRSRKNVFLGIIMLISVILAIGVNPPFGNLYIWFYLNTPFLSAFREAYKFLALTTLAYALLIGSLATNIRTGIIILCVSVVAMYMSGSVFFSGNFDNHLHATVFPSSYYSLQSWTKTLPNHEQRIFLLPSLTHIAEYPWVSRKIFGGFSPNLFHAIIPLFIPLANTGWNNTFYGMRYYHFVDNQINNSLVALLWKMNAKYLLVDTNFSDGKLYNRLLTRVSNISETSKNSNLTLYQNALLQKEDTTAVYYPNFSYLVGDTYIASLSGKIPLVSLYQNTNIKIEKDKPIYFYNSGITDAVAAQLYPKYATNPEPEIRESRGATHNNWIDGTADVFPFDNGYDIISQIPITTSSKARIDFPVSTTNATYAILMRPFFSRNYGIVDVLFDGKRVFTVDENSSVYRGFSWIIKNVVTSSGKHILSLQSKDSKNIVIDALALAPFSAVDQERNALDKVVKQNGIHICDSSYEMFMQHSSFADSCVDSDAFAKTITDTSVDPFFDSEQYKYSYQILPYKTNNPSIYHINLGTENKTGLLIFNQSYDPNWRMNNEKPIVANLFANGFILNHDKFLIEIKYLPENLYRLGLYLVSAFYAVATVGLIALIIRSKHLR